MTAMSNDESTPHVESEISKLQGDLSAGRIDKDTYERLKAHLLANAGIRDPRKANVVDVGRTGNQQQETGSSSDSGVFDLSAPMGAIQLVVLFIAVFAVMSIGVWAKIGLSVCLFIVVLLFCYWHFTWLDSAVRKKHDGHSIPSAFAFGSNPYRAFPVVTAGVALAVSTLPTLALVLALFMVGTDKMGTWSKAMLAVVCSFTGVAVGAFAGSAHVFLCDRSLPCRPMFQTFLREQVKLLIFYLPIAGTTAWWSWPSTNASDHSAVADLPKSSSSAPSTSREIEAGDVRPMLEQWKKKKEKLDEVLNLLRRDKEEHVARMRSAGFRSANDINGHPRNKVMADELLELEHQIRITTAKVTTYQAKIVQLESLARRIERRERLAEVGLSDEELNSVSAMVKELDEELRVVAEVGPGADMELDTLLKQTFERP